MKRILSVALVTILSLGFFASCNVNSFSNGDNLRSSSSLDEITLTLWSIATESDAFSSAYASAIKDFEESHIGVKIKHETFENESYKTKIKSSVSANELPDIFFTWAGGFSQAFVDSGKVLCLQDYYDTYKNDISMTALNNAVYEGKLYGSVICTPISVMWYNKSIFNQNKLNVPLDWDEFKNVCKTLKNNGISPIATSAKDTWVLAMLHDGLTLKSAGHEKVYSALKKGDISYNDPDFLLSAQKIRELADMGAFIDGATRLSNDEASDMFYSGDAAMYFTGSWMGGSIENPDNFGVAPIPVINSDNAKLTDFMGGGSDSLMVAASTKYPDLAAEAAFEITRGVSKYGYLSGAGIPAWKVDYDASEVPFLTQEVAQYANNATSFTLWFDTLMESEDAGEYLTLLQELYIGNISAEEFQSSMAKQMEK